MHTRKSIESIPTTETWGVDEKWQVKNIVHGSTGTERLLYNPNTGWVRTQYIDVVGQSVYWCDDNLAGETTNYRAE